MASNTTEYKISQTQIPGLMEIDITSVDDDRGFFQEKFQKEKLEALGFPKDFVVVQQNVSYNKSAGSLRGIHAEPWNKYISVIKGRVFAVFVDLRKENFGKMVSFEIASDKAVFVPKGVANSYQTLASDTYYSYLVDDLWRKDAVYKSVNPLDPKLSINWPISEIIISDKDKNNPLLADVEPF